MARELGTLQSGRELGAIDAPTNTTLIRGGVTLSGLTSFRDKAVSPYVQRQQETNQAYKSGEQGINSTIFQTGGNIIGAATAPFISGASKVIEAIPENPVTGIIGKGISAITSGFDKAKDFVAGKVSDIPAVQKFAQTPASGSLERNIQATNEYLQFAPVGKAIGKTGEVISEVSKVKKFADIARAKQDIDTISGMIAQGKIKEIGRAHV